MYEELIATLRETADKRMHEAADAIEELRKDLERSKEYEAFWNKEAEEALRRFQVAVDNKPRWIPVTEQLPKKGMRVLCACRANIFCVLKWDGIDWVENQTHVYMRGFVTNWMPLPEPPKEET